MKGTTINHLHVARIKSPASFSPARHTHPHAVITAHSVHSNEFIAGAAELTCFVAPFHTKEVQMARSSYGIFLMCSAIVWRAHVGTSFFRLHIAAIDATIESGGEKKR